MCVCTSLGFFCLFQALDIMNKFHISVSSSTVLRRKKDLVKKHAEMRQDWFCSSKGRLETATLVNAALDDQFLDQQGHQTDRLWQTSLFQFDIDLPKPSQGPQYAPDETRSVFHFQEVPVVCYSVTGSHREFVHTYKSLVDLTKFEHNMSSKLDSSPCDFELLGDNFDMLIDRTVMTKTRQRNSVHWFLVIGKKKSLSFPDLDDSNPKQDISLLGTEKWLPSDEDMQNYETDLDFHTVSILIEYLPFLTDLKNVVPKYIDHPFMAEMSQKSKLLSCDLLDESENSSEGMIRINNFLHEQYIPKDIHGEVIDRIVFGGDVLTNERAFSAQMHVNNGRSSFTRTGGIIHRPEGLHRQMNLVLV
jgi:hypothetical protein